MTTDLSLRATTRIQPFPLSLRATTRNPALSFVIAGHDPQSSGGVALDPGSSPG
jgi:hypothetical protein